jgi:uncharacterized membrane protein
MKKIFSILILMLVLALPIIATSVLAVDVPDPSSSDLQAYNAILEPVMKVYNFVKYAASVLALMFLVFAAISMFANDNPMEKEKSKTRIMYVVIGLIVIWVAPIAVNYLTA